MRLTRTLGTWMRKLRDSRREQREPGRAPARDPQAIRAQNTFAKVLLTADRRSLLFSFRHHPGYEVFLDMMESVCVEQETVLINAPASETAVVLAEHTMAKAFWQVFVATQKKVEFECAEHLSAAKRKEDEKEQADEVGDEQFSDVYVEE